MDHEGDTRSGLRSDDGSAIFPTQVSPLSRRRASEVAEGDSSLRRNRRQWLRRLQGRGVPWGKRDADGTAAEGAGHRHGGARPKRAVPTDILGRNGTSWELVSVPARRRTASGTGNTVSARTHRHKAGNSG